MRKGVAVPAVMTREEQDLLALQEWEAGQSQPPTLFDVLATRSVGLVGAYILRAFREAAAVAVEESERVAKIRRLVLEACDGDLERAEELLRSPNDLF